MAFSQATMLGEPTIRKSGRDLVVSWSSSDSPGSVIYQVYLDKVLAWSGTSRTAKFPLPRQRLRVDVGTVASGESAIDFSASLPSGPPPSRVTLTWTGGLWEAPDLAGFHVYSSAIPGGPIDYSKPVGTVMQTSAGVDLSGFGLGGFGLGGFGYASASYSWTSDRLASGVWKFGVVPFDKAGNDGLGGFGLGGFGLGGFGFYSGPPAVVTQTVASAPTAPAPNSAGKRLTYTYNSSTRVPTLAWLASPG
jgi:hypothetical protein